MAFAISESLVFSINMRSPESETSHFIMSFELSDSAFKSSDEHQNCEALSWGAFLKDCEFPDFCAFGLSPVSVGALFEAVGAQQRKRKCKPVVRSTLLHLSLLRGPSGKIQSFSSLHGICNFTVSSSFH